MTFSLPEKKTVPEHQADAYLSQDNPVSGTWYTVLDTTKNVRVIAVCIKITWATTQPSNLIVRITIDGKTESFDITTAASATWYYCIFNPSVANDQFLVTTNPDARSFLVEGRSVKVEANVVWATTQPTLLECRIKYAKW